MQDRKWFRVSLHFHGDFLPVDEIETGLEMAPTYVGRTGEHRHSDPRYIKHLSNIWTCSITEDTSIPFDQQIGDLLDILEPKKPFLQELLATPGSEGEIFLGFSSSNGQGGTTFYPLLLERLSKLGLSMRLDLYPPVMMKQTNSEELVVFGVPNRPEPLEISLEEFIRTGALAKVEVGMERNEVEARLGLPDRWSGATSDPRLSDVWQYGSFKLSFNEEILQSISVSEFEIPSGGDAIALDGSIITDCLTLSQLEKQLNAAQISYRVEPHPRTDSVIRLVAENGATLSFSSDGENDPILFLISYQLRT